MSVVDIVCKSSLGYIFEKVHSGKRISFDDALVLYDSSDLLSLGYIATEARKQRLEKKELDYVYFINNHHINITNICEGTCKFCAYKKEQTDTNAYFMTIDEVSEYISENVSENVTELHIVSGLNDKADLNYYCKLFETCKKLLPNAHIQALTSVELDYLCKLENKSPEYILQKLLESGLGSLPGGGAEIFNEEIRNNVCPEKISGDRWLEIMEIAHNLGVRSNATMLSGIGESYFHRVEHLDKIRSLQDKTSGFMSFIPLVCHYQNTDLTIANNNTGIDNLKDLAIARIYLDNFKYIKAFWIQLGVKIAQISLEFGVNDLDGTVVKEKISKAAGANATNLLSKEDIISLIRSSSKIPVERDTLYNLIKIYNANENSKLL